MSPTDSSCSMIPARMSAWLTATSTWKRGPNSQAKRGSLMVAMVRGTSNRSRAMKQSERFSTSLDIEATRTCASPMRANSSVRGSAALPS